MRYEPCFPEIQRLPGFSSGSKNKNQNAIPRSGMALVKKALAVTYSRMRMHTTIGAGSFHFRVREGIGWYQTAMAARETLESR